MIEKDLSQVYSLPAPGAVQGADLAQFVVMTSASLVSPFESGLLCLTVFQTAFNLLFRIADESPHWLQSSCRPNQPGMDFWILICSHFTLYEPSGDEQNSEEILDLRWEKSLSKQLPVEHFSRPPDLFSWCGDDMIAVVNEDFRLLREEHKNTLMLLLEHFRPHQSLEWDGLSRRLEPHCHTIPTAAFLMSWHELFKGPKTSEDEDAEWGVDEGWWDSAYFLPVLPFPALCVISASQVPEWPEASQSTNKKVNKEMASIDPWALKLWVNVFILVSHYIIRRFNTYLL